jgi:hypothetical protein
MQDGAAALVGTHDFSAFRAAECQAKSPVRTLSSVSISAAGDVVRFDFRANAYLHHMIRNVVGALVHVGAGKQTPSWIGELLAARDRTRAPPTFSPTGFISRASSTRPNGRCRRRAVRSRLRSSEPMAIARTRVKICGITPRRGRLGRHARGRGRDRPGAVGGLAAQRPRSSRAARSPRRYLRSSRSSDCSSTPSPSTCTRRWRAFRSISCSSTARSRRISAAASDAAT